MEYVPKHTTKMFFNGFNVYKLMVCKVCNCICSGNHYNFFVMFYCCFSAGVPLPGDMFCPGSRGTLMSYNDQSAKTWLF